MLLKMCVRKPFADVLLNQNKKEWLFLDMPLCKAGDLISLTSSVSSFNVLPTYQGSIHILSVEELRISYGGRKVYLAKYSILS